MSWGAGVVAALGLGRNIGPSDKDRETYADMQEQKVADAYGQGFEDARNQFTELAKTYKQDILNAIGETKGNYIIEFKKEPAAYDYDSMRPIGTARTYLCKPMRFCIELRPDKEFMRVTDRGELVSLQLKEPKQGF